MSRLAVMDSLDGILKLRISSFNPFNTTRFPDSRLDIQLLPRV
jgi:hypothetical protein